MIEFTEVRPEWTHFVAEHMRVDDRREMTSAMFGDDVIGHAVMAVHACPDMLWTGWHDGAPVWIGGAVPRRPGVWELVMFATDDFPYIRFGVTRLAVKGIIPAVFRGGAHRIFATTAAWRHGGARWLEVLGLTYEGTRRGDLADGSDLLVYAMTGEVH
jgi:hypothetical protein